MPGGEAQPVATKPEARSTQDRLLHGYENLTPKELALRQEMGEVASENAGVIPPSVNAAEEQAAPQTLEGDGSDGSPPVPPTLVGHPEQPALPPGRGEQLAITAAPERQALPSAEKLALPPGKGKEAKPIVVGHIDLSHNAERKAYDIANHKIEMMKKENEARFLLHPKRIARNIWGYNYTHRKALIQARQDIIKAQDVNVVDEDFNEDMRKRYGEAIFDQFFHAPDEAIDEAAGEHREFFADDHEATKEVRALYAEFARTGTDEKPAMSDDEFNAAIKEVRAKHMNEPLSETATGLVEQDNYLEVARSMRGRIEQGEAIDDVLEGFKLMRGESRADARTDVHRTKLDNLLDKYEKSRFGESKYGSLVPSTVIVAGVSAGAFLATRGLNSAARAAVFFGGSAAIGALAGAREYRDITRQRAQMGRETFHGKDYSGDSTKRNEALSQFDYERLSVDKTLENLDTHKEKLQSAEISANDLNAILNELANIQVLKTLSASMNIDLLDHGKSDDPNKHIKDRTALAVKQAELKVMLGELLKSNNPEALSAFSLENEVPADFDTEARISELISSRVAAAQDEKIEAVNKKDELFRAYRRKEALKKGAKVAAFSFVAGTVIQEAWAALSDEKVGLVEQAWGGNNHAPTNETMLAGFLPDHEAKVEHINTKLPDHRVAELRAEAEAKGGYLEENHTTTFTQVKEQLTPAEWAKSNPGDLRHFENVRLFDNNTSQIDMNELGGQLSAGPDGTVQPWDTMARGGSIDGSDSMDMTIRSNNVFTIALKQPDGTHLQKVFEYGQNVDKPWADLLYQKQDGTWGFKGDGYIAWGQSAGDTLNVAASIAGDGGSNTLVVESSIPDVDYDYVVHAPATDRSTDFGPAVWLPRGKRLGVAQRPVPAATPTSLAHILEQAPVGKDKLPVPTETTDSVTKITDIEEITKPRAEPEQQKIAREAGWPLPNLKLDSSKSYTAEQWKAASEYIDRSNALNPNVTDSLERLQLAVELAERESASAELKKLLDGIYQLNLTREKNRDTQEQRATGPRPDARSYNRKTSSESDITPPTPERVTVGIEKVNQLLDSVIENQFIRDQNISPETLRKAREIYKGIAEKYNVINENGEINVKLLTKRAISSIHPDANGDLDPDLAVALTIINTQIRPKNTS